MELSWKLRPISFRLQCRQVETIFHTPVLYRMRYSDSTNHNSANNIVFFFLFWLTDVANEILPTSVTNERRRIPVNTCKKSKPTGMECLIRCILDYLYDDGFKKHCISQAVLKNKQCHVI